MTLSTTLHKIACEYQKLAAIAVKIVQRSDMLEQYLRSLGVWDCYAKNELPQSPQRALLALRGIVHEYPEIETQVQQGQIPDNIVFRSAWTFLLFRYGHRGMYEGDIAYPRFGDSVQQTLAYILSLSPVRKYDDEFPTLPPMTLRAKLALWCWSYYKHLQEQLEYHRSEAMRRTSSLRRELIIAAEQLVRMGRLQRVEEVWHRTTEELITLGASIV